MKKQKLPVDHQNVYPDDDDDVYLGYDIDLPSCALRLKTNWTDMLTVH